MKNGFLNQVLRGAQYLFCLSTLLSASGKIVAQDFQENYQIPLSWSSVGTDIFVGGGNVNFNNVPDASLSRVYKPLGFILPLTWRADIEFTPTLVGAAGVAHTVIGFTAGALNQELTDLVSSGGVSTNQNCIRVTFGSLHYADPTTYNLSVDVKNGTKWTFYSTIGIPIVVGKTYYISVECLSATQGRLSVYTDPARTVEIPNSPQCFSISSPINDLNTIQHSASPSAGSDRFLSASAKNLKIWKNIVPIPNPQVNNQTICAGTNVTLNASGSIGNYNWFESLGATNSLNSGPTFISPVLFNSTTYYVESTYRCAKSVRVPVVVIVNPMPVVTVTASSNPIMSQDNSNLSASGADFYSWAPSAALNTNVGPNVIATPTVTTNYVVKGTRNGCSAATAIQVTVLNCFSDNYSNPALWTKVADNNGAFPVNVANNVGNFINDAADDNPSRIFRPLNFTLPNSWRADIEFLPTIVGLNYSNDYAKTGGPSHTIMGFTAGVQNMELTDRLVNGGLSTNQNCIRVTFGSKLNAAPQNYSLSVDVKNGTVWTVASPKGIPIAIGVRYFISLEYVSGKFVVLSVFTDQVRTQEVVGSPLCFPLATPINGLNTVQHGVSLTGSATRVLDGQFDNLNIGCNGPVLNHDPIPSFITKPSQEFCPGESVIVDGSASRKEESYNWAITECDANWNTSWAPATTWDKWYTGKAGVLNLSAESGFAFKSNKYYLLRLSVGNCENPWVSAYKLIHIRPTVDPGPNKEICSNTTNPVILGTEGIPGCVYAWSPRAGIIWDGGSMIGVVGTHSNAPMIQYTVTMTDTKYGCVTRGTVNLKNYSVPSFDITTYQPSFCDNSRPLSVVNLDNNSIVNGLSYKWLPSGETSSSITINPTSTVTNTAIVSNKCYSTQKSIVSNPFVLLNGDFQLYYPNAFRPNGVNKIFKIVSGVYPAYNAYRYEFSIFNRDGNEIYTKSNSVSPAQGSFAFDEIQWNGLYDHNEFITFFWGGSIKTISIGDPYPSDVYVWKLILYNCTYSGGKVYSGAVTLVSGGRYGKKDSESSLVLGVDSIQGHTKIFNDGILFPNPTTDVAMIYPIKNGKEKTVIYVTDVLGKLIVHDQITDSSNPYEINLIEQPKGIYHVKLVSGTITINKRLVKQ